MGRNSKARRDARKRKQTRQQQPGTRPGSPFDFDEEFEPDPVAFADLRLVTHLSRLGPRGSAEEARARAASLQRELAPWPLAVASSGLLRRILNEVVRSWGPTELADAVERILKISDRAVLAGLLHTIRPPDGLDAQSWQAELSSLGPGRQFLADDRDDLALALRLGALFAALPSSQLNVPRPPVAAPGSTASRTSAKLEQVRQLLAKAEATAFPEEAEALSTKAQELISKHSLQELLEADASQDRPHQQRRTTYRRLWLEAPYVDAKASLVQYVCQANRCRTVYSSQLSFCTVVGTGFDIDAVELMVTSLLAQAQQAMLRHGSRTDLAGRSRTRSFRSSFLISFAVHIGERLRRAAEESVSAAGGASLLPVLRGHETAVRELTDTLFPDVVHRSTAATNAEGWAGGRVAAELADLELFAAVNR